MTKPALLIASAITLASSQGATVFQSASISNSQNNIITSDSGSSAWLAGYVTVSDTAVLRSVEFAGFTSSPGTPQTFEIAILAPDGAAGSPQRPGTVVLPSTSLTLESTTLLTGSKYRYQADLPVGVNLTAGNYWVSIVDTTPTTTFSMALINAAGGSWATTSGTSQTTGYGVGNAAQLVQMNGSDVRFGVPEPSTALIGLSSLALIGRRRRR